MTEKRKAITEKMKIDTLLYLVLDSKNPICCPECKLALTPDDKLHWDHRHPHALGGGHNYLNLRPMHVACHKKKPTEIQPPLTEVTSLISTRPKD